MPRTRRARQRAHVYKSESGNSPWDRLCKIEGTNDYQLHCLRVAPNATSLTLTLTGEQVSGNEWKYTLTCTTLGNGSGSRLECEVGHPISVAREGNDLRPCAWVTINGCKISVGKKKIIAEQPDDNFLPTTDTVPI